MLSRKLPLTTLCQSLELEMGMMETGKIVHYHLGKEGRKGRNEVMNKDHVWYQRGHKGDKRDN